MKLDSTSQIDLMRVNPVRLRAGFSLAETLLAMGILMTLAFFVTSWVLSARVKAKSVGCISVLRQLHSGFAMYAAEHGGALPAVLTEATPDTPIMTWAQRISPYVVGKETVYGRILPWAMCPGHVKTTASELFGNYGMFDKVIQGGRMIGLEKAAEIPLFFDAGGYQLGDSRRYAAKAAYWYIPGNPANAGTSFYNDDFAKDAKEGRHGNNLNVLFMDGHVISIPAREFVRDDRFWRAPL